MNYRKDRLEELIRRIVSEVIVKEIKDPRIGFVTITDVELNKDFSEARIGVSIMGSSKEVRKGMEGVRSSSGFVQKCLGKQLQIRNTPRVYFYMDKSVEKGVDMISKIEAITKADKENHVHDESEDEQE